MSLFRLMLIPLMVWLYWGAQSYIIAGAVLILSGLTDIADGFIARRFNMISDLGKVLDPMADHLTQAAMLACLLFRFPLIVCPLVPLIAKEIFMSVCGLMLIKNGGRVFGARWHGKTSTCLLYAMMTVHVFWPNINESISALLIFACCVMTSVSFVLYAIQIMGHLKENVSKKTSDEH